LILFLGFSFCIKILLNDLPLISLDYFVFNKIFNLV